MVDIIDHAFQAVSDVLESLTFDVAVYNSTLPEDAEDEFVLVRGVTTIWNRWQGYQEDSISVMIQALHDTDARDIAMHIQREFDSLHDHKLRPPEWMQDREIVVSHINADPPIQIGDVGEGRFRYSIKLTIKHGENKWE